MKLNSFGETIVSEQDIFEGLYSGKITSLDGINIEDHRLVDTFNSARLQNADQFPALTVFEQTLETIEEFDKRQQADWFMPKDYCPNLVETLYSMCETTVQTDRVTQELELFIQHGMYDLLHYLKYLVDTMRENNIVWGVGRGSSVASYVLYLLGVHKIDSIKYELDIHEFLK